MKMEDKLNTIFNIDLPKVEIADVIEDRKEISDFEVARDTIKDTIDINKSAIDTLMSIATSSEHPRAFEVLAELVKAQTGLAKELMVVNKVKKDIDSDSNPTKIDTQNNIVFAGSTADLMKMISAERAKIIDSK